VVQDSQILKASHQKHRIVLVVLCDQPLPVQLKSIHPAIAANKKKKWKIIIGQLDRERKKERKKNVFLKLGIRGYILKSLKSLKRSRFFLIFY